MDTKDLANAILNILPTKIKTQDVDNDLVKQLIPDKLSNVCDEKRCETLASALYEVFCDLQENKLERIDPRKKHLDWLHITIVL